MFLAGMEAGVEILDVSVPSSPQRVAPVSGTTGARTLLASGQHLFVGLSGQGVRVFDLADPVSPALVQELLPGEEVSGLSATDGRLCVSLSRGRVSVFDFSDPKSPVEIAAYQLNEGVHDVARRTELTQAFFPCLEAVLRGGPLVLFLDEMEYAEEEGSAIAWIREELLVRIRNDGLSGLIVVLAGRNEVDVDPAFFHCMRSFRLQPFELGDIQEYLERRGLAGNLNELARMVLAGSHDGHPDRVARMTNSYLLMKEAGG